MLKDILKDKESNIPQLSFHSMTLCGRIITIYGGLRSKEVYCGDLYFLKLQNKSFIKSEWSKNKQSKINLYYFRTNIKFK